MLMASFEAEMKRQMATRQPDKGEEKEAAEETEEFGNQEIDVKPDLSSDQNPSSPSGNAGGCWKRASTPADGGSDDAESLIRGGSAPDDAGSDIKPLKTEPEDGNESVRGLRGTWRCCSLTRAFLCAVA